ncbi:MAG: cohesin domain-containing protein [Candidatus Doudnabacteria bacterium]
MKKILIVFGIVFAFAVLPRMVLAATLYASPSSGSFGVGSSFTVSIKTNTQGAAVNTAEATISYSTDTLDLVSVKQGSTFFLSAPGSPAKGTGTAYFGGGLPTPGYNDTAGVLGTMTFRAKASGTGIVTIDSGKVLLNDGNGTNAFTSSSGGRFTITAASLPAGAVTVTSVTDPVSDDWYNQPNATFSWDRPAGVFGYSFVLDQIPDTVPDDILDTTITTSKSYTGLTDGTWYFHIKARVQSASAGFGRTTDYKIQVDTSSSPAFEVKLLGGTDANHVTQTPTIIFEAMDATSGIDHYEIVLDNRTIANKADSPYTFDKIATPGAHLIKVLAFDKAGNEQTAQLPIQISVAGGFLQKTWTLPVYLLLIVNLLILLIITLILWLIFKRKKKRTAVSDEIADIQAEIDHSLEQLKQRINNKLLTLTARSTQEIFNKEEQASKDISVSVNKTRKSVDKKIGKLSRKISKQKEDKILE